VAFEKVNADGGAPVAVIDMTLAVPAAVAEYCTVKVKLLLPTGLGVAVMAQVDVVPGVQDTVGVLLKVKPPGNVSVMLAEVEAIAAAGGNSVIVVVLLAVSTVAADWIACVA